MPAFHSTAVPTVSLEEAFEAIAQEAIEAAEKVECSLDDFVRGLDTMMQEIQGRHRAAEEEQQRRSAENDDG